MGKLNPKLSVIIQKHINPIKKTNVILNSESDAMRLIKDTGMLNIDGCEVYFKLNIKTLLQYSDNEGITIKNIRIVNSKLYKGISFYDVLVKGNLYFWENTCGSGDFSNMIVEGCSYFSNTIFNSTTVFDHAIFKKDCFFWGVEFLGESYLRNCSFNGRLDFWCALFEKKMDLSHSFFEKEVDFSNTIFRKELLLRATAFGKIGSSSVIIFDNTDCFDFVVFSDSNFWSEISISKSKFHKKIDFSRCSMHHTLTASNTFFKFISFNYSHIYLPLYLLDCVGDIECIDFQNTWIDSIVNISHDKQFKIYRLSFNKSIFSNKSIITIEGINIDNNFFELNCCNILGVISIYNSIINFLEMKCSSVIGSLIIKDSLIGSIDLTNSTSTGRIITDSTYCFNPCNRESANILRHQKENEGDVILSLKYKEIEMRRYKEEFDKLTFFEKIKNIDEIIIVKLNFWSNDYGQSWIKGVIFTFIVSFIFTLLLSLINKEFSFSDIIFEFKHQNFWRDVVTFLWLPSSEFKSNELLYISVSVLGKILVAYGMFQTVMSFRKYTKS